MATQPRPRAASAPSVQPNPANIFAALHGFQLTFAMRAAVELDIFTAIAEGQQTPSAIAMRCNASERGVRALCDFLTIHGMLEKSDGRYSVTTDTGVFLNSHSPAYMGGTIEFLLSPHAFQRFGDLTNAVRNGGATDAANDTTAHENPIWERFARGMGGMMGPIAQAMAACIELPTDRESRVLDIAASHGMFGFSVAQRYPKAHVTALDWNNVLPITAEHAAQMGLAGRFSTIAGDAFKVDFERSYDLILLPNILHHFSPEKNQELLAKCLAALTPNGSVAIVEFVPNDDRISPPMAASFSLTMLAGTPEGNAYTFEEFLKMLNNAGYSAVAQHALDPLPETVIIGRR